MNTFFSAIEELHAGYPIKIYHEEGVLIQEILNELKKNRSSTDF